jgi:hypothetical protein
MATERIISPGVFTNENDLSFLPAGIAAIGAAFIGPTLKGPAGVPMQVTSYQDYQIMFGGEDSSQTYIPYAVKNYLRNASSAMVVRILGDGGWSFTTTTNKLAALAGATINSGSSTTQFRIISGFHPAKNDASANLDARASTAVSGNIATSFTVTLSGSGVPAIVKSLSINPQRTDYITKVLGTSPDATKISNTNYSNGFYSYVNFQNYSENLALSVGAVTVVTGSTVISQSMGTTNVSMNAVYSTAQSRIASGSLSTSIANWNLLSSTEQGRVTSLHIMGSSLNQLFLITVPTASLLSLPNFSPSLLSSTNLQYVNLFPDQQDGFDYFGKLNVVSGSNVIMYISRGALSESQLNDGSWTNSSGAWVGSLTYTQAQYPVVISSSIAAVPASQSLFTPQIIMLTSSYDVTFADYSYASTPWITSGQILGVGISYSTQNLFKAHHLSDGTDTNTDVKISITNLREFSSGSYSTFDLLVRSYSDTDNRPNILEQYRSLNLNPDSPQYIARVIGDKYKEFDTVTNKVVEYGNYANISKYIRIEMDSAVDSKAVSETLSPRGFRTLKQTFIGFANANMVAPVYSTSQNGPNNSYTGNKFLGWEFGQLDNVNYLKAIPTSASVEIPSLAPDFIVDNYTMPINSGIQYNGMLDARVDITGVTGPTPTNVQFTVPLQGGSDGMTPAKVKLSGGNITATNSFGYNLSTATSVGSVKYTDALDTLANQDEYDINGIFAPGVIKRLHPYVAEYMISTAEDRQDAFTIVDVGAYNDSIATVVNQTSDMDTNYAATYYPWMQVLDTTINKPIWVPPSVLMPGVLAFNDSVSAEWYAPAGLNRGGITDAINVTTKLSHSERDTLYENNVNPIASFPGQGICAWGQKTLQQRPSALDRINVRRLLITVKKYIASTSRFLVFEQNTAATRNRFLSIVNPYLESIQQRQGLYAFRVVMDDTNNTPAVIDRNLLVGDIYLQPSKTAEFIVINFNLTPTGMELPA